ncbi:MAG TPA: manganese efflux pump [Pseudonocardiaceae bacterium]|jgi:putative Mn2+ efflux pump MntP
MTNALALLFFVLPLGLDAFAIAAAVGATHLSGWARWRISAIFVIFEGGTPLVGLALGASIGDRIGGFADYLAGSLLIALGAYLYRNELNGDVERGGDGEREGDEETDDDGDHDGDEAAKARRLISARGLALIGLALSVSLDELAIGFGLGLGTDLAAPGAIIAVIGVQTLLVSQLGLALGARISEPFREYIERCAGPMLVVLGAYMLAEVATQDGLITARDIIVAGIVAVIFAAGILYRRYLTRPHSMPRAPLPFPSSSRSPQPPPRPSVRVTCPSARAGEAPRGAAGPARPPRVECASTHSADYHRSRSS